jgi:hypothetical protein
MGFFLSIDFYQIRKQNVMTGFNFAFINQSDKFSSFDFDFASDMSLRLSRTPFYTVGAGLGFGSYHTKFLHISTSSHLTNYRTTVMESTAIEEISAFTFGAAVFQD